MILRTGWREAHSPSKFALHLCILHFMNWVGGILRACSVSPGKALITVLHVEVLIMYKDSYYYLLLLLLLLY